MALTAIYARVSTDEQAEHGTSLDEQVRRCREHAGGAAVVAFVDEGLSGRVLARPRLQELLAQARRHEFERVLCLDPDRLARNLLHQLLIVEELRDCGVEVEFLQFEADTATPDGKLLFHVRGAISEFEAAQIKRRLYSGKLARAREGRVAAGTCIYGYRLNRLDKRWEEEPREAQVVRLLFEWALESGTWEIARRLNRQDVPARFGGRWSQSSVLGILRNATYTGRMPQMGGAGHVPMPPLVSGQQFAAVQGAIRARRNTPTGRSVEPYLLSGRLTCGVCGRAMCGGYGRRTKTGRTTYYGCTARTRPARAEARCPNHLWRADRLDDQVWRQVTGWLLQDTAALTTAVSQPPAPELRVALLAEQDAVDRALARVEAEQERVLRAFRRGVLNDQELACQRAELAAEAGILQQRRTSVAARLRAADPTPADPQACTAAAARTVAAVIAIAGGSERRAVLAELGVRVTAGPADGVRIRLDP